jgi:hypothetical protein
MPKAEQEQCTVKRCVDGIRRKGTKEYVGYCWFKEHKGYLTRKLMKEHQCTGKECHYFQKFEDAPYWKEKAAIKKKRKDKKEEERTREVREKLMLQMARGWSDQYTFMDFTSAKQTDPGAITLTYFTKWTVDLARCADYMSRVWKCSVNLRRIEPDRDTLYWFLQQKKGRLAK